MKLTSDQPYWLQRNKSEVEYPSLESDTACQCVVVGAGVTGAMLGDRLSRAGYDVIVVDRQTVCTGSTSASTALLLYDIDVPLVKLSELIGQRNALRAYALSYQSIDAIEELALGLSDDVEFRRNRSIYLAVDERGANDIRREVEARSEAGMSVDYHQQPQLRDDFGLVGPAALSTVQAASCDPIRLARGLLTRAQANGARIFDDTQIVEFGYRDERVELTTKSGCRIQAQHGIIACGYESVRLISEPIVTLNNTYALISQPLQDLGPWSREWMLWEARNPYLYMRVTADNRLLMGGEDDALVDSVTRDGRISHKMHRLHAKLSSLLPDLSWEPSVGWAGTFGQTKDGLPYIGRTSEMPGYLFALGFGGNGMTFSEIACQKVMRTVRGEPTPDAHLFRFGR